MTVNVPTGERTGAAAIQAKIATLSSRTDYQSQQLLNQTQIELVNTLLDQRKLSAASILSTVSFSASKNPLAAAITAQSALVTKYGASPPGYAASATLDQLQRQAVQEMMISGAMPAASILAAMTYSGGASN
jgi:hypothetical protein